MLKKVRLKTGGKKQWGLKKSGGIQKSGGKKNTVKKWG